MADIPNDAQLLDAFVLSGSQQAFGTLVSRHVDMVYAAALRQVRQAQAAEDVSQTVFALLARKAASLHRETIPAGMVAQNHALRMPRFAQTRSAPPAL